MHLNLYRKTGRIATFLVSDVGAYERTFAIINHPLTNFYRLTLTDPLAGERILRDTYIDQREKV